ncbi:hypothetical protein B0H67DRAFT_495440 [Lasiosphaeris hirsuta]|uniref:Impact N-terminal domain-containing protein n=1 Tax=Lasiosphaeris hirsuta TaxID=260670 RepID=A0AA40A1G2_9PEZI|nr:hypothetical protein B0H67DRAFT_495440 [Lasiosphaeris hirsuta]
MATQQDLQELLRLLTVSRKIPMMQAMAHIKALQAVNLRSIKQIAESDLPTVESAIKDNKAAKMLQSACKAVVKRGDVGGSNKRAAPLESPTSAKRARSDVNPFMGGPLEMSPQELERSLDLPVCMDEERIAETVLKTNRAPLVLAFAVELLRHTMPEQPPSSRLSLGQAVVSANSRSKAVSLGLDKGPSADEEGYGEGQPRVRVMGREVAVLKRGDYEWRGDETVGGEQDDPKTQLPSQAANTQSISTTATLSSAPPKPTWTASQPFSLKKSTFIARAAPITSASEQKTLLASLLAANPSLQTATHNAWAYRLRPPEGAGIFGSTGRAREASFDDGETGCGDLMLRVMREAGAVDTMVVLTRWFGGVFLGPDRWRLMRNCVAGALSERLRRSGAEVALGGEAVWGLDLEAARAKATVGGYGSGTNERLAQGVGGMQVHRPEAARAYLFKAFATAETAGSGDEKVKKKKTIKEMEAEKEANLALLLGALRIVFDSWADHLAPAELDRRAWGWYTAVRPEVDGGPAGWGAKSILRLSEILKLKRKE